MVRGSLKEVLGGPKDCRDDATLTDAQTDVQKMPLDRTV